MHSLHPASPVLPELAGAPRILPLAGTQQGIWLADQVSDRKNVYVISHYVAFDGPLQIELLIEAIRLGLSEADTVTARYVQGEDGGTQHIAAVASADIAAPEQIDLRGHSDGHARALAWMWADTHADAALTGDAPLYRQALFQLCDDAGQESCLWYQRFHHIMLDGFSFTALTRRIAARYSAAAKGQAAPATPFIGVDAVVEEYQHYLTSPQCAADRAFWNEYGAALPPAASLSTRGAAEQQATSDLVRHEFALAATALPALRHIVAAHPLAQGTRLAAPDLLLGLLAAYLYRVTGQPSQTIGVPMMRRMGSVAIRSVAPVVNVLPVRVDMAAGMHWCELATQFKRALKQVRPHQRYDAEQIQRDLGLVGSGQKLCGALINYKMFDHALDFAGAAGATHPLATGPIDDLEFGLLIHGDRVSIELRADAARYDMADLLVHSERIVQMLDAWLAAPEQAVSRLPLLTPAERLTLSACSQGKRFAADPELRSVLDVFFAEAARAPSATALVCGDVRLSFSALAGRVAQLSRLLMARGAGPQRVVAVAMPRSADSVVAMLAVLGSGATFLPLDLDYPAGRMAMMCEDASPVLLLSQAAVDVELPAGLLRLDLDAPAVLSTLATLPSAPLAAHECPDINADSIAYVIFTSGSTGRPKGVMNTHGALLNLLLSHRETIYAPALAAVRARYPGRPLRAAHTHSFSFDSSWLQIFWMLQGQELHVFDEDSRRDAHALVQEVRRLRIDAMDLPPSFLAQMLGNGLMDDGPHQLSLILIGGEAAPAALWRQLRAYLQLQAHNLYGPTEYTVDTLRAALSDSERPVIGRPIGNTRVQVLDACLQPVPVGVVGELYLSGHGLALGYLARGALTAGRFIANPYAEAGEEGARMYRSGDLVRWNGAGRLEFVGRGDDQVKVRGYRVEIGEVENALSLLPGVESVVVLAQAVNNSHRLVGYCVVPGLDAIQAAQRSLDLLAALRENLPDYMAPAALVVMDAFPRNVSGKVDRKLLPAPQAHSVGGEAANAVEAMLCGLMAKVLKLDRTGVEDDFFAVGGDSISAIMLCTELRRLGHGLRPSMVFAQRTARRMAQSLERHEDAPPVETSAAGQAPAAQLAALASRYGEFAAVVPVLPLQKGMLFHVQLGRQNGSYNAFTRLQFHGALDGERLRGALNAVLARYPQLAGCFDSDTGEEPLFLLPGGANAPAWPWRTHDLSRYSEAERASRLAEIERTLLAQDYPTDRFAGMLNAALVRLDGQRHVLLQVIHHLVVDGWSTPLLLRDLLRAYQQPAEALPSVTAGYASVITQLARRDLSASRALWRATLAQVQPTLLFDHVAPSAMVDEFALTLPATLSARIMAELRVRGLTLNVLMQGVWAVVLGGMAGRDDLVFGTPVSGRGAAIDGIEEQVGLFLNTLPVRVQLQPHASLWDQLPAMQRRHIALLEHDGLGLAELQRIAGAASLFDTLLVVENYPDNAYLSQQLTGADGQPLTVGDIHNRGYSHYPLALLVLPGEEMTLLVENRGAIADAAGLAEQVERILRTMLDEPALPLSRYPLQSEAEAAFLRQVNATAWPVAPATLRSALAEQAARTPHAPALADAAHSLTYAETRYQVAVLAAQLSRSGVQPGDIVAVALPRSVHLSLAIMAVVEAGAAYLPLDLGYPDERLAYMLGDAKARLLICGGDAQQRFAALEGAPALLAFDTLATPGQTMAHNAAASTLTPDHPAYLIYTSGTTGRPKGVLVSHRAIVNRIAWMQHEYGLTVDDVVLQKTPCSFDVSVWEFFWPLTVGARLVMADPEAHRDPQALVQTIEQFGVSCLHFVPSMLVIFSAHARMAQARLCRSLRLVFCSGEALSKAVAQEFAQLFDARLHNLYGPTEAAVDVSYRPAFGDLGEGGAGVPIGRPVWNTQLRVLDQYLRPVPVGVSGELYLCGVQLAIGYLGRADLSASRFVADPFGDGERMYRTGDMVRWLASGDVEYLGRADDQIKIRGQRIELGEIETLLLEQAGVAGAVVHAVALGQGASGGQGGEDHRQLVAYLVMRAGYPADAAAIKDALQRRLPAHMVPVAYVELAQLPLSSNGKLDRKALPAPSLMSAAGDGIAGRAPAAGLETELAAVFAKVLGVEQVYADDDFFMIGGHSLLAMRLAAEIRRALQRPVSVGQVMTLPTVEKLAAELNEENSAEGGDGFGQLITLRAGTGEGTGAPLFCFYPGSGFAWQYSVLSRYLDKEQAIIGLQSPRPGGVIASSANMEQLIERQLQIMRGVQAQGPYYLLGYSLGGTVAYGVAARLRALGETVNFLGLLDTYPAEAHDWTDPQGAEAAMGAEREQERLLADAYGAETLSDDKNQMLDQVLAGASDDDASLRREKAAMLRQIFANYKDAVRLLSQTRTPRYDGEVQLFVAEQSLPDYIAPRESWLAHVDHLQVHSLPNCSHENILSPQSLETLGPLLNQLLLSSKEKSR